MTKMNVFIGSLLLIVGILIGSTGGFIASFIISAKYDERRDAVYLMANRVAWATVSELCDNILDANNPGDYNKVKERAKTLRDVAALEIDVIDSYTGGVAKNVYENPPAGGTAK